MIATAQISDLELVKGVVRAYAAESGGKEILTRSICFPETKPFLKWAGGKQWLAPLAPYLRPPEFGAYCEPFLGAGAMFFSMAPSAAFLSDANEDLVTTYRAIRDDVEGVIARLSRYPHNRRTYEHLKRVRPRLAATAAARFLYLNRTAFNGIYRVNRAGEFNVPFGRYKNPTICQSDRLRATATLLQGTVLTACDFEQAVAQATPDWFVYFDPPYITGHLNNGFVKWNSKLFTWTDQHRLAKLAGELANAGVKVLLSNADHPAISELYADFHQYRIHRRSLISAATQSRRYVPELIISTYPITINNFTSPYSMARGSDAA